MAKKFSLSEKLRALEWEIGMRRADRGIIGGGEAAAKLERQINILEAIYDDYKTGSSAGLA
jgi:hypothetical protein